MKGMNRICRIYKSGSENRPLIPWPYTVLLCLGIAVFCYIFYALEEYGSVIESATNATEELSE